MRSNGSPSMVLQQKLSTLTLNAPVEWAPGETEAQKFER